MKKFFESIKNIRNVIKFIAFLSDAMKSVVDCYERHYPQLSDKEEQKEVKEEKMEV